MTMPGLDGCSGRQIPAAGIEKICDLERMGTARMGWEPYRLVR